MGKLEQELAGLATLSPAQLREKWEALVRGPVPRVSEGILRLALAYELQVKALGGLSRDARRVIEARASAKPRTIVTPPGTRLAREWNGTVHIVSIEDDNSIVWNGKIWRSLSEVARAITGTRWSGPRFFGLKEGQAR